MMNDKPIQITHRPLETTSGSEVLEEQGTSTVRLQRVADYQSGAAARPDPLEANLGLINGGLMRIGLAIDEAVTRALAKTPITIEQLDRMRPTIEMYLRITRQVDRFAQLELKCRVATAREAGLSPPTQGATPSEELAS